MSFLKDSRKLFLVMATPAFLAVMLASLWQPERQALKHHAHLLAAMEKRDWKEVDAMIDAGYTDRWNHDKRWVLRASREAFRHFFSLTIRSDEPLVRQNGDTIWLSARITIEGTGTAIATMVLERSRQLREPFTFEWKHRSWKPWDWALVRVDQPQLSLEELGSFEHGW
jgi:hypothetical protein